MVETVKTNWFLTRIEKIINSFRNNIRNNNSILDETVLMNVKRVYYWCLIAVFMRMLNILLFSANLAAPSLWGKSIIFSHYFLLIFYSLSCFISYRLKNKLHANTTMHVLQYIVAIVLLASGVVITAIDQLVTTNITPFFLVCIVFGAVFLIRPVVSGIFYLASYLSFYYLLALTTTNQQVLLSNRVNGISMAGLGLLISVMGWQYNYTNITQKRRIAIQQEQLKEMAYHDSLTGLNNRHFFNMVIEKELSSIERYGHESVIIILDIDDFKKINDTYGHLTGDQVLKQMAQLISSNVRKSDTVARFGGEEFIIMAPSISLEEGFKLAEKLRRLINEEPFTTGSTTSHLTASFGVSLLLMTERYGLESYFSLADQALNQAKRQGKNRVEKFFSNTLQLSNKCTNFK